MKVVKYKCHVRLVTQALSASSITVSSVQLLRLSRDDNKQHYTFYIYISFTTRPEIISPHLVCTTGVL